MKINLTSVPVNDQSNALAFYTQKLGFVKKEDEAMGEHRWLTVTSPEGATDVELLLEPLGFEPAKEYYASLYNAGIPVASFESNDLDNEMAHLQSVGVEFRGDPAQAGNAKFVLFDDTCGNLLCLTQRLS